MFALAERHTLQEILFTGFYIKDDETGNQKIKFIV